MNDVIFYYTLRQGLWVSVLLSAPILGVALITGLAIGLFQALTSVQELTLTFVPKLLAMVATFWVSMAFMTEALTGFFSNQIVPLIAGG